VKLAPALLLIGAAAYLGKRVTAIASAEGRPVKDVVTELPRRLVGDIKSLPDDLRSARDEGKLAADREMSDIDERIYGSTPPPPSA
jgi:hypothetical protein